MIPLLGASASLAIKEEDNKDCRVFGISHQFSRLLQRVHYVPGVVPKAGIPW